MATSVISDSSVCLNIIHVESTSCEEYEFVQNLFHRIIRDVRHQRESFQLSQPLHIIEEVSQKSQKTKSNTSGTGNSKRTKSPKHEANVNSALNPNSVNANSVPVNLANANNFNNMSVLPTSKDGSLKKNKFPFLNKILNKS